MPSLKPHGQMSEAFITALFLSVSGGLQDVYTYLYRGKVFANAQTGNIVLLGVNLADGALREACYYLIPIAAFAAGVLAVEMVKRRFYQHPRIHWRQIVVAAECLALFILAFVPLGTGDIVVNPVISFLCAMQVQTFRKIKGDAFASTMCTGNLRSATELFYAYRRTGDRSYLRRSLRYYGVILFFIAGAVLGALLSHLMGAKALLICCFLLAVGFGVMFIKEDTEPAAGA